VSDYPTIFHVSNDRQLINIFTLIEEMSSTARTIKDVPYLMSGYNQG